MDREYILLRVRQKIDRLRKKYDETWENLEFKTKQQLHSIGVIRRRLKLEIQTLILIEQLALQSKEFLLIEDEDAEAALISLCRL